MKECGILRSSKRSGSKIVDFIAAISLGISEQHGDGPLITEEEEERGSTKEIAEKEDQRLGEAPTVVIRSA